MAIKLIKACKELNIKLSQAIQYARQLGYDLGTDPNTPIDDGLYLLLAEVFNRDKVAKIKTDLQREAELHSTESSNNSNNMSNIGDTFAYVCKRLEITSTQKAIIMEKLSIKHDNVLIDYDTFDKIFELQRDLERAKKPTSSVIPQNAGTVKKEKKSTSGVNKNVVELGKETCNICLKFHDKAIDIWNNNQTSPFKFDRLQELLKSGVRSNCYFQKLASNNDSPRCTMFVILAKDCCIELRLTLNVKQSGFKQFYCFFVPRVRVVALPPRMDYVKANCSFNIIDNKDNGVIPNANIYKLMEEVEKLPFPRADVNQERDKAIWNKYVEALRKLVYQKEQIWRVKSMSEMPYYSKELANEDDSLLDIVIEERDLLRQFEKEIAATFDREGLIDYGVNTRSGFLEFSGERDMSKGETEKLVDMAVQYFYELTPESPTRSIVCLLKFKYNTENIKETIYPEIANTLLNEYQLEVSIEDNGRVQVPEKYARHVEKVISDKYAAFLTLYKDNSVRHIVKANVKTTSRFFNAEDYRAVLAANNVTAKSKIYFTDGKLMHIKVGASLSNDLFTQHGFQLVKKTYTFFSYNTQAIIPIDGLYIEDGTYCLDFIDKQNSISQYLKLIHDTLHDDSFVRGQTHYVYEFMDDEAREILRDFKTDVEKPNLVSFSLQTSILTITAEDAAKHRTIIDEIRRQCPDVIIEDAYYSPQYYIHLKGEAKTFREETISAIQNALRLKDYDHIKYDSYRNFETTAVTYTFNNDGERKQFIENLEAICAPYKDSLEIQIENELGTTLYEFKKNDRLVQDKERELRNNIRQASFVYLNAEEYNRFKQARKEKGDAFDTREGIQIGTLIQKEGDCFTFKISNEFLDLLDTKGTEALKGGFIRPIFPGELTNINRMVRAMHKITSPDRDGFPANPNISNFIFDPSATREPWKDLDEVRAKILENLNEPLLKNQPKQLEAVTKAIAAQDIAIIQGPPGTGKTTVIAEIIWQTLLENGDARILITSQTNLAVDNALERLKGKRMVRPIRIGNIDKFEDEGKVYSDTRLKQWTEAPVGSVVEGYHKDNAIHAWINSVCDSVSDDAELAVPLKKWRDNLRNETELIKRTFAKQYNQHINVFAATCSECGSRHFSELFNLMYNAGAESAQEPIFDLVIMDEASKATPPELVLPLTLGKKVVVIGDHKQLPPMIDSDEFAEALGTMGAKQLAEELSAEDLKVSQFEKLFSHAPDYAITSLDTQFRMHEQIMKCISQFYADQKELERGLVCGIKETQDIPDLNDKASRWHGLSLLPFLEPDTHAIWVNVDTPEQQRKNSTSYYNLGEVEAIQTVLRALTKADGFSEYMQAQEKEEDKEIGVITYYMSQMRAIRNALYPSLDKSQWRNFERFKCDNEYSIPFRINTVDRFQGMERNIVIVSTVRSNKYERPNGEVVANEKYPTALGFAKELQRINVGFSRAKRLLIVVGNKEHFAHKPEYANAISQMKYIDISQLQNL